ncbi:MAG: hypothetical protein HC844_06525 [Tabrizicola sp.]|nr:hypothetical protein [Tabrizicola sp.]
MAGRGMMLWPVEAGGDRLDGGSGFDLASYADAAAGVRADLSSTRLNKGDAAGDSYAGIEGLEGSAHADQLLGDAAANRLSGGEGNDSLWGRTGNDTLEGGAGDDILNGGAGADTFVFHAGRDVIHDFEEGLDRIEIRPDLWGGTPPAIEDLLHSDHVLVTATGLTLVLTPEASLELRGIFDIAVLHDDIFLL